MTTRRGSQYSIQSDGAGLKSRLDPSKGKTPQRNRINTRKCHIPKASPTNAHNIWARVRAKSRNTIPKRGRKPRKKPKVNPLPQEGKKNKQNKKKNARKPYSPSYKIPKIQKDAMENVFNMARTLMEFKDKEEQRMRQPNFRKK
ncbi:hypothetical protein O181_031368 [Austropuccinia psidii MF-1]|uniref:Uncharacterized protein n=1 Tax=Austropuccinia psidii MF-1 TaxID=1389203 RepID=A0A9Q3CZJ2_9BASI|nr:hypothetical protein [Austropuccinia psidii MF-1]